jgi:hypothetical protein
MTKTEQKPNLTTWKVPCHRGTYEVPSRGPTAPKMASGPCAENSVTCLRRKAILQVTVSSQEQLAIPRTSYRRV